jgi:hypothetical protein
MVLPTEIEARKLFRILKKLIGLADSYRSWPRRAGHQLSQKARLKAGKRCTAVGRAAIQRSRRRGRSDGHIVNHSQLQF